MVHKWSAVHPSSQPFSRCLLSPPGSKSSLLRSVSRTASGVVQWSFQGVAWGKLTYQTVDLENWCFPRKWLRKWWVFMSVPYPWSPSPKAAGKFSRNPHLPAWAAPREKVGFVSSHWGWKYGSKFVRLLISVKHCWIHALEKAHTA